MSTLKDYFNPNTTKKNTEETSYRRFTMSQSLLLDSYVWFKESDTIAIRIRGIKNSILVYSGFDVSYHLLLVDAMIHSTIDTLWLETIKNLPVIDKINC